MVRLKKVIYIYVTSHLIVDVLLKKKIVADYNYVTILGMLVLFLNRNYDQR